MILNNLSLKNKVRKTILANLLEEGIYPGAMIVSRRFIEGTIEALNAPPPSFLTMKINGENFHLFYKGKYGKTVYLREGTPVMFLDVVLQVDNRDAPYYFINVLHGDNIIAANHTPLGTPLDLGITSFLREWKRL